MGEKTDEIEQHIREQRRELGQNISELQQKVKDTVNWRAQFEQHPVAMLGIAVGSGFLLAGLFRSRSRNVSQASNRPTWDSETPVNGSSSAAPKFSDGKTAQSLNAVKSALIGVAAAKLGDVIESVLPGFNDEYSRVRRGENSYSSNRL